jgi:hypothetical protein
VCKNEKHTSLSHHRSAEAFRHPLRNGVTIYSALSPVTGFLATVIDFNAEASSPI